MKCGCGKEVDREPDTLIEIMIGKGKCWRCLAKWRKFVHGAETCECGVPRLEPSFFKDHGAAATVNGLKLAYKHAPWCADGGSARDVDP